MTTINEQSAQTRIDQIRDLIARELVSGGELTVIARSAESPVVRAVEAARVALIEAGASLRFVLLQAGARVEGLGDVSTVDVRHALNPRLLEAHEQLVVGQAVWIGDCMRRDPGKRDAFTQVKVGCNLTTTFAVLSFEKLWAIGTPVVPPVGATDVTHTAGIGRDAAG